MQRYITLNPQHYKIRIIYAPEQQYVAQDFVMSQNSFILVLLKKIKEPVTDMTKIAIKSDKITPFGGIFWVMQQFDRSLSQVIDSTLGVRYKFYGYQYSEILHSLMCVYFCGGSCVEDLSSHLILHYS